MSELILHQYLMSPFSQKVRKVLAYKDLAYREVEQPAWMPKPHLTPLTGGYRRIPVLQIGADVYCDSALIVRKLEEIAPTPSIYPDGNVAAAEALAEWADKILFVAAVPLVVTALADEIPDRLLNDRTRMSPDFTLDSLSSAVPSARSSMHSHVALLETTLAGRPYLLGPCFSVADAAVFHCLWFARSDPGTREMIGQYEAVSRWLARLEAMGSGRATPMEPDDALAVARASQPQTPPRSDPGDPNDFQVGAPLTIAAGDVPSDVFEGELLYAADHEIAILRNDPRLGALAVHFPRSGYIVNELSRGQAAVH